MRSTAYMTAAHYEAYGAIDELQAEVARVRHAIEKDWRGKILSIPTHRLDSMTERLNAAVCAWHEEDEDAPTIDEIDAAKVAP